MKKVLMVMAHPDDELIFGWPVLMNPHFEVSILCCSSDKNNPERKKFRKRKKCLADLCNYLNIEHRCLDYNSCFYKLPTRDETLKRMLVDVVKNIIDMDHDIVFTHNSCGEYGHLDHILINSLIINYCGKALVSDICLDLNWMPLFTHHPTRGHINDLTKYNKLKEFYDNRNCWTWNQEPVESCSLILEGL